MTDETSQLLSDTAEKLFSDHVTKNCIIDAEKGTWPDELWSEVIANGFNLILVPEELGGVGGNWMNAGILFKASGRYQAPIPLAENIVASYILSLAGISQPQDSILTILNGAFVAEKDLLSGSSPRTPFASHSTHGVVLYKDGSDLKVGAAFTVGQAGVVTATSFSGDGSALTGVESWNQFDTWLYGGG